MNAAHRRKSGIGLGLLALFILYEVPAQAQQYTLTELGTPLGGTSSYATGINGAGQVVGYYAYSLAGGTYDHATLWNGSTPTDLGTLGGLSSYATGINSAGQVVGYSQTTGDSATHATLWIGPTATDLGTFGGTNSYAYGINSAGQVAGYSYTTGNSTYFATVWNGTTATNLGGLGGTLNLSAGFAINSAGQVVGYAATSEVSSAATLWNGTTITGLGNLGGKLGVAYGINDAGQAVGAVSLGSNTSVSNAVLWNGTTATNLGTLGGISSAANGINSAGQVVGYAYIASEAEHATLWEGGKTIDLNSDLTGSLGNYVTLTDATAISDNGWIAADGTDSRTGQQYAYLLAPVPLPAAAWLLVSGLGYLVALGRRRAPIRCRQFLSDSRQG